MSNIEKTVKGFKVTPTQRQLERQVREERIKEAKQNKIQK